MRSWPIDLGLDMHVSGAPVAAPPLSLPSKLREDLPRCVAFPSRGARACRSASASPVRVKLELDDYTVRALL